MHALPKAVYSADRVRALDRHAIERQGVSGYALMCRAGMATLQALRERWPQARRLRVWCGAGNNAGDGYVIARLARAAGLQASAVAVVDPRRLQGDARTAWEDFTRAGGTIGHGAGDAPDVEVDALLGTGLARAPEGAFADAIAVINASDAAVVAVDLPSGVHADSGSLPGAAVRADLTVTFIGLKTGLLTGPAVGRVGEVVFDALGIDAGAFAQAPSFLRLQRADLFGWLPLRARDSHKGSHGDVLVVGGGAGMPGAVRLAAEAALRAGAGLVRVATLPAHVAAVAGARPELICHGIAARPEGFARLAALAASAGVIAVGPGLGRDAWARRVWRTVLAAGRPMVVDADALGLLSDSVLTRDDWVLTPHPGEAARLLGIDVPGIQRDRPGALAGLNRRYGGVAVLKGAGTLVGRAGDTPWLCTHGNPGMASAGTGDVLTGVIAGLAVQMGGDLWRAARAGVLVHALAGDRAERAGMRGLLAGDLMSGIRACVNPGN